MIATLVEVLQIARRRGHAVCQFNVYNLESIQAVIEAAEHASCPVILGITEKSLSYGGEGALVALAEGFAKRSSVPTVVHLDHGRTPALVQRALSMGFSSVMLDVSGLKREKQMSILSDLTYQAHSHGISVEGEKDVMPGTEDEYSALTQRKTDPADAAEFVRRTRVDAFAVVVGNVHGARIKGEKLDIPLIVKIHAQVKAPIVLHGASSTPRGQILSAIAAGIEKINIDTDLRRAFVKALRQILLPPNTERDPRKILTRARAAMTEEALRWLKIISGKA